MPFAIDASRFARLAHGTAFAFKPQTIDVLSSYLLDGQQWMIRGRAFDYSAMGRNISRPGNDARPLVEACDNLMAIDAPRKAEFEALARRLKGDAPAESDALVGNRFFWRSDFAVNRRKTYHFSVKMASTRTVGTEKMNGENLMGAHLLDGATYLLKTGDEYRDIFPLWDWSRIPGTTWLDNDLFWPYMPKGLSNFVGGVSDGTHGLATMDLVKDADWNSDRADLRTKLTGKKSWFFFEDQIVCLGAGIACEMPKQVWTTVNQCFLNGDVVVDNVRNSVPLVQPPGEHVLRGPLAIQHDGVAYVFLNEAEIHLTNDQKIGTWDRINTGIGSADPVIQDVFTLWIGHGLRPANGSYAYVIVPSADPAKPLDIGDIQILSNTPSVQAVYHPGLKLAQVVFHAAIPCELPNGLRITVDEPCVLLLRAAGAAFELTIADPTQELKELNLQFNRPFAADGAIVTDGNAHLKIPLPAGLLAGSSVKRTLSVPAP